MIIGGENDNLLEVYTGWVLQVELKRHLICSGYDAKALSRLKTQVERGETLTTDDEEKNPEKRRRRKKNAEMIPSKRPMPSGIRCLDDDDGVTLPKIQRLGASVATAPAAGGQSIVFVNDPVDTQSNVENDPLPEPIAPVEFTTDAHHQEQQGLVRE